MEKAKTKQSGGKINAGYLERCIQTLEAAFKALKKRSPESIAYEICRAACVKEFEIILEQCGSLLKKQLREYLPSNKATDKLKFKDIFRYAAKHGLISSESAERGLLYRDCRDDTAHDYGKGFAEEIIRKIPAFAADAKEAVQALRRRGAKTREKKMAKGKIHLPSRHKRLLEDIFRRRLPNVEVWAYGSRVTGESHGGSDLDLALRSPGLKKIDLSKLSDLEEALAESNIPFLVEAGDWAALPKSFHLEIEKSHAVLFRQT